MTKIKLPDLNIAAFDPGGHVGFSVYFMEEFRSDQIPWEEFFNNSTYIPMCISSTVWIIENYRPYPGKAVSLTNNSMLTPQIIGLLKGEAAMYQIDVIEQSASSAKGLCTDELLKEYDMFTKGKAHANDSSRHLLFYLLTHRKES